MYYTFLERCYFTLKYNLKRLSEDWVDATVGNGLIQASTFDNMVEVAEKLSFSELLGHDKMSVGLFFKLIGAKCAQFANWVPGGKSLVTGVSSWWNSLMTQGWGASDSLAKGMIVIAILAGLALLFWILLKVFKWIRRKIKGVSQQNYSEAFLKFDLKGWAARCPGLANQVAKEVVTIQNSKVANAARDALTAFKATRSPGFLNKLTTNKSTAPVPAATAESVARYIWKNTSLDIDECAKIYNYLRG